MENSNRVKRQSVEQEKIFENYLSHKKLISRIYLNLQVNSKNPNALVTNEQET